MKFKPFTLSISFCLLFLFLFFARPSNAQHEKQMSFKAEAGEITIVPGIGAIIKGGDGGLVIMMIPEKNQRDKKYKNVNLSNEDKIIMCNGKKVKTIEDLNKAIESVAIGEEISFGIRRGKEMMIASFPKADPKESGKMMMMTTTIDDDGAGTDNQISIMKDGVEMKDVIMLDAGMILKDIDGQTNILVVLPELASIVKGEKPQDGDIIISFNGKKILSSKEINKKYNSAKIGETISLTLLRDSKEFKISFKKPKVDDSGAEVIINK